jgi:hypothetical protein
LRVYTHEWKYRDAQRSQIGAHLGQLFNPSPPPALPPAPATREPLALPAGS